MNRTPPILREPTGYANAHVQIPFGLHAEGHLVDAYQVPRGLACACTCPGCGQPLIARRGRVRQAHFAHAPGIAPCAGGAETALHRMAKKVLAATKRIGLPAFSVEVHMADSHGIAHTAVEPVYETRVEDAELVEIEVERPSVGRPDAVMRLPKGRELLVEFRVTHAVGPDKKDRAREVDAAMVEIDLRPFLRRDRIDEPGLRQFLLETRHRDWISHPDYHPIAARLAHRLMRECEEFERDYAAAPLDAARRSLPWPKPQYRAVCHSCGLLFDRRGYPLALHLWPTCPYCHEPTVALSIDPPEQRRDGGH